MTLDFLGNLQRTQMCGELRATNDGDQVVLMGWVNRRRDHGNLIFLDLRDRSGITQIVLDKEHAPEAHGKAEAARSEFVVAVKGRVRLRGEGTNPNMATGAIEVLASELLLLNEAKTPPFSPADDGDRQRRGAAEVPLSRPAPAADAAELRAAQQGRDGDPQLPGGRGLPRDRDAVHDALDA